MEEPVTRKRTPLHAIHRELGAKLVDFAGWEMPVEYGGVVEEHLAVRQAAGLFDVSHMGEFTLEGGGAAEALERLTPNDVSKLKVGQAHYSALLTDAGTFVDDLLVYRLDESSYLTVVNASNIDKDFEWMETRRRGQGTLRNRSEDFALLALQGPRSQDILAPLASVELPPLAYYHFVEAKLAGERTLLSRTGYTGEDGFEIFVAPDRAETLWRALLDAGTPMGLKPAGLAARDTLRLEARMALYGNDIDDAHTPLEAGLGWIVKLDKGDFVGRAALVAQREAGVKQKLVGFEMVDKGIARHGYPVLVGGKEVGPVTSGTYAPYLKKTIGLTYLPVEAAAVGSDIEIVIRGRQARARVVPTPFYKREK